MIKLTPLVIKVEYIPIQSVPNLPPSTLFLGTQMKPAKADIVVFYSFKFFSQNGQRLNGQLPGSCTHYCALNPEYLDRVGGYDNLALGAYDAEKGQWHIWLASRWLDAFRDELASTDLLKFYNRNDREWTIVRPDAIYHFRALPPTCSAAFDSGTGYFYVRDPYTQDLFAFNPLHYGEAFIRMQMTNEVYQWIGEQGWISAKQKSFPFVLNTDGLVLTSAWVDPVSGFISVESPPSSDLIGFGPSNGQFYKLELGGTLFEFNRVSGTFVAADWSRRPYMWIQDYGILEAVNVLGHVFSDSEVGWLHNLSSGYIEEPSVSAITPGFRWWDDESVMYLLNATTGRIFGISQDLSPNLESWWIEPGTGAVRDEAEGASSWLYNPNTGFIYRLSPNALPKLTNWQLDLISLQLRDQLQPYGRIQSSDRLEVWMRTAYDYYAIMILISKEPLTSHDQVPVTIEPELNQDDWLQSKREPQ